MHCWYNLATPFLVGRHASCARRAYDLIMIEASGIILSPQVNLFMSRMIVAHADRRSLRQTTDTVNALE